jgi:flagellar hook-associated protein 1 FlgK
VLADVPPPDPWSSGGGVDAVAVTASRAPLVEARLRYERPAAARERATSEHMMVIEAGLGLPGQSLDAALGRFYNTYNALAQNPTAPTARQQVILEGDALSKSFHDMSQRFSDARRAADDDVRAALVQVNALAKQLADINRQVSQTNDSQAQGLLDQQQNVVTALSELIDIGVITRDDGSVDISVGNGQALVIGQNVYDLSVTPSPVNGYAQILSNGGSMTTDITAAIGGGRIGGLVRVRDTLVPQYQAQLDQLAYSVATDVNALVTTGYDRNGNAGVNFFTAPTAVAGAARAISVNATVAGNSSLVVASATTAAGNNQIARAVGALQSAVISGGSNTPLGSWGNLVYNVATDASSATQAQKAHEQVAVQLENLRDQISGISLDEEAASLMKFQRAYEANARFFNTIDETLDMLLGLGARL